MTTRGPDLLVVGGGPAGLSTAIAARRAGLAVQLIDSSRPPIDKACGEGIMPEGVALLEKLGVEIAAADRFAFKGIRWIDGEVTAEARLPGSAGWGVRRPVLHAAMVERAHACGVELCWGVTAKGLTGEGVVTGDGLLQARYIVAADGLRSRFRREAGLEGPPARRRRLGLRRHYTVAPWTDHVEVHWSDGAEAYVTPLSESLVGVAMLFEDLPAEFDLLLSRFPALAARVSSASAGSTDRGAGPLEQHARAVVSGRLALVGDAAGDVDAITGEGLSLAMHDAFAVTEAILKDDLSSYAAAHRRAVRLPDLLTRMLLAVERRPRLRRGLIRALSGDVSLFPALLALHVRSLESRDPASGTAFAGML